MTRRVESVGVSVETVLDTNNRRIAAVGLMVEQKAIPNLRVSVVGLMVEWGTPVAPTATNFIPSIDSDFPANSFGIGMGL